MSIETQTTLSNYWDSSNWSTPLQLDASFSIDDHCSVQSTQVNGVWYLVAGVKDSVSSLAVFIGKVPASPNNGKWKKKIMYVADPSRVDDEMGGDISEVVEAMLTRTNMPEEPRGTTTDAAKENGDDIRITTDIDGFNEIPLEPVSFERDATPADANVEIYTQLANGVGGEDDTGTCIAPAQPFYLTDTGKSFLTTTELGGAVINRTTGELGLILEKVDNNNLRLHADIMSNGDVFDIAPARNVFWMWYGNANADAYAFTDPFGRNDTWTEYVRVTHDNETGGTNQLDATGNGNVSVPTNMDSGNRVAGEDGQGYVQALNQSTSDEYLAVADDTALRVSQDFSLYIRMKSTYTGGSGLKGCINTGNVGATSNEICGLWIDNNGDWQTRLGDEIADTVAVVSDTYTNIVLVSDFGATAKAYIDGVLTLNTVQTASEPANSSEAWDIGRNNDDSEYAKMHVAEERHQTKLRTLGQTKWDFESADNASLTLLSNEPISSNPVSDDIGNLAGNFNTELLGGLQT